MRPSKSWLWITTCIRSSQLSHHVAAEAVDGAFSRERHQLHLTGLSRLEAHRGACGDIEPHAAGFLALELQRRIGLEEMIVRADLDRAVTGIGNRQRHGLAAGIELDLAVLDEQFDGDHEGAPSAKRALMAARAAATAASNVPSRNGFKPRQPAMTCSAQTT